MTLLIVTHEARVSHAASRVLVLRDAALGPEDAERSMETL
jgi:ABC-type lipoprotein export system ATPase subunit